MGRAALSAPAASRPPPPPPPEQLPEKLNLDDQHALKHKLDATAAEVRRARGGAAAASNALPPPGRCCSIGCCCHRSLLRDRPLQRAGSSSRRRARQRSALLHLLQLRAAVCFSQVILQSGYEEDHLISNVKIALGLTA